MKLIISALAICTILFVSCTKEDEETQGSAASGGAEETLQDSILYFEMQPILEVTSVREFLMHPSYCGTVNVPLDSSATLNIDINSDGTDDYYIYCKSWYNIVSASNPCSNYNRSVSVTGVTDYNQIAKTGENIGFKNNQFNDLIDSSLTYSTDVMLRLQSIPYPTFERLVGSTYLGLKMMDNDGDHYGWLYINNTDEVITVMSFAINHTPNNSILAGQME